MANVSQRAACWQQYVCSVQMDVVLADANKQQNLRKIQNTLLQKKSKTKKKRFVFVDRFHCSYFRCLVGRYKEKTTMCTLMYSLCSYKHTHIHITHRVRMVLRVSCRNVERIFMVGYRKKKTKNRNHNYICICNY